MEDSWIFASGPIEDRFHEQLLLRADSEHVVRLVQYKLRQLRRRPFSPYSCTVDGRAVYAIQTGPFVTAHLAIPGLVIAYSLDYRWRMIELLHVAPASEVVLHPWDHDPLVHEHRDRPEPEPLERVLQRMFGLAERWREH